VIPLQPILSRLNRIGYRRLASVEMFNPKYWRQPPAKVAKTAFQNASR